MRTRDATELLGLGNPRKGHELAQVRLVGAARLRVVDVGEPGHRRRHVGQFLKVLGRQPSRPA